MEGCPGRGWIESPDPLGTGTGAGHSCTFFRLKHGVFSLRKCSACGEEKPIDEFYSYKRKDRKSPSVSSTCKVCFNLRTKEKRDSDPAMRARQAAAEKLRRETDPDFRQRKIEYGRQWYADNKDRQAEYGREYRKRPEFVERDKAKKSEWNKSERGREYFAERQRRVRQTAEGKVADAARKLLSRCLDITSAPKTCRTYEALGYAAEMLRDRIACQFLPGMSWENHGEWHIDHKKPVSAFIAQGVDDPKRINALCNLQPLWARDNLSKGDKWTALSAANDNVADANAA